MWALTNYSDEKLINIGSGNYYSIKKIVLIICKYIGVDKKKNNFNKDKPRGVMHRRVDTTFLNSLYKKNLLN